MNEFLDRILLYSKDMTYSECVDIMNKCLEKYKLPTEMIKYTGTTNPYAKAIRDFMKQVKDLMIYEG